MRTSLIGRCIVTFIAAVLAVDGLVQFASPLMMVEMLTHIGFSPDAGPKIAVVTLTCALLLVIPRTAPLGAILATGFLGGAITAHFRLDEIGSPPQLICLALGTMMWFGMSLADRRVRDLLPSLPSQKAAILQNG